MSNTDREMMAAIVDKDATAFETLVDQYGDRIRQHIIRMVRDEATTADLYQSTLMKIWDHAEQWRGDGRLISWLLRIATNLTLNHLDHIKRRRETPLELPEENMRGSENGEDDQPFVPGWMIDPTAHPDLDAEHNERAEIIQTVINTLPPEKRTVFYLAHQTSLELNEIADKLGVPEGTVKSRLHYTMKTLMAQWKEFDSEGVNL